MPNFTPNFFYSSVKKIKFKNFENNFNNIVFDYDNTLAAWNKKIDNDIFEILSELSKKFKLFIFSNGNDKRISKNLSDVNIKIFGLCKKPLTKKICNIIKNENILPNKTLFVGDNMITDIYIANNLGFTTILVQPISKKEFLMTKVWRFLEKILLLKLKLKLEDD